MTMKRLGVVGSGIMGAGIAECAARAGFDVVIRSRRQETADGTVATLRGSLGKRVDQGKLAADERDAILARVATTVHLEDLAECDLVIESIVEDLAAKQHLFAELDRVCPEAVILATNTSTLPVIDLARVTGRPQQVCGIHFFNPAPVMATVELVRPLTASHETMAECRAFAEACGKEPVEVKDRAGFIVNALLFPYLNNAARMLDAGVAGRDDIDAAMRGGCGFPMGPLALLDLVGLDTSVNILEVLHRELGEPNYAPVPILRRMVSAGWLGRKSGRGFYTYP
ncbi:MAG TPA: 3-hydroxybutyryl-CoA dehydrogenase [Acidimicrobiales bacterium]|nr:3-hydroxybutyryl-CoA dehydrogenase [Acidimicrobiales bacterium]